MNSDPRSKVTERLALWGRVRMTLANCPMTRVVVRFPFNKSTVNLLTRSTRDVTFDFPDFCRNSIKSDSQCPNWTRSPMISGRFSIPSSGLIFGFLVARPLRGRRFRRCSGKYHHRSSFMPSGRIYEAIYGFLAHPNWCAFIAQSACNLFRGPPIFDPVDDQLT